MLRVWDIGRGCVERELAEDTGHVRALLVRSDGRRVVSGGDDGTVRYWDIATGEEVARWVADSEWRITSCAVHPHDATSMVYGDSTGRVVMLKLLR